MASDLELATRVEGEGGAYVAQLSEDWEIWGPNGGYLAAIALRAAGKVSQIERPSSFYCHFLSPPAFDDVRLEVSILKRGHRAESFAVEMRQQDKPILHAMIKMTADAPGYSHQHLQAPDVPSPADLETYRRVDDRQHPAFSFWNNLGLGILVTVFAAAGSAALGPQDLLAQRVAASLTVGTGMLALALVLVVTLIVRPRRAEHESSLPPTSASSAKAPAA